eukprot:scaffold35030_cov20-Cyclotella_meneghiniana.AAC.1
MQSYFNRPWKAFQLDRRKSGDKKWESLALDRITWKNLRLGICPFFYFSRYVLNELKEKVDGLEYIPVCNKDSAALYGGSITNTTNRQALAALALNGMYDSEDVVEQNDNRLVGSAEAKKHNATIQNELKKWIQMYECAKDKDLLFDDDIHLFQDSKLEMLAKMMNNRILKKNFIGVLVHNKRFQQGFVLSVGDNRRINWFGEFLTMNGCKFDDVCRSIFTDLFAMLKTSTEAESFEFKYRKYLIEGEKFRELVERVLPQLGVSVNRPCALYLVNTLKDIFVTCLVEAITSIVKSDLNIAQ